MITDRDPGDEDDRDDERIVSALMARSLPVATSRRVLERRGAPVVPMCGDCWDPIASCQCPPSSPSGRLLASKPVRL